MGEPTAGSEPKARLVYRYCCFCGRFKLDGGMCFAASENLERLALVPRAGDEDKGE